MISAIILAAGSGKRMGPKVDKLMLCIAGRPLLVYTLLAFEHCPDVEEIILVARLDRQNTYRDLVSQHHISKLTAVIPGGVERQDSVWCGLQAVSSRCEIVLIHDGARAMVTSEIISRCIAVARSTGAAIPASPVKDTVKRVALLSQKAQKDTHLQVETTLDRTQLWAAQTPQTFHLNLIRQAYQPFIQNRTIVTDDATAVERMGHPVSIVETDPLNLKITTSEDLLLVEAILLERNNSSKPFRFKNKTNRPNSKTSKKKHHPDRT